MSERDTDVTFHGDEQMAPETAEAFGKMVELAIDAYGPTPICPRCGSPKVIEPVPAWPAWTCDPCGLDFMPEAAPRRGQDDQPTSEAGA